MITISIDIRSLYINTISIYIQYSTVLCCHPITDIVAPTSNHRQSPPISVSSAPARNPNHRDARGGDWRKEKAARTHGTLKALCKSTVAESRLFVAG